MCVYSFLQGGSTPIDCTLCDHSQIQVKSQAKNQSTSIVHKGLVGQASTAKLTIASIQSLYGEYSTHSEYVYASGDR